MGTPRAGREVTRRLLYVGGVGRSGSTLLELLLAQTSGVCGVGEIYALWARRSDPGAMCGCGQKLSDCPLWRGVLADLGADPERLYAQQQRVDRTRYAPLLVAPTMWPPFARRMRSYLTVLEDLYGAVATRTASSVVIDSSKRPANALLLRRLRTVDLRVVHLVRDGRAVAYSWTRLRDTEPRPDPSPMVRYSPARICLRWSMYNLAFSGLRLLGVPVLRLHYEDLVADPREALSHVAAFAGIDCDLEFLKDTTAQVDRHAHTVTGNPVRFARGRIDLVPDEEWRTALPRGKRLAVSLLSWPLLVRYGYLLGRRRAR